MIELTAIALRSVPTVPRPNVPLTCMSALRWRLAFLRELYSIETMSYLQRINKARIDILSDNEEPR